MIFVIIDILLISVFINRLRLTCSCANLTENQVCSRILPFDKQQWYAYMGNKGDSHWKPRDI